MSPPTQSAGFSNPHPSPNPQSPIPNPQSPIPNLSPPHATVGSSARAASIFSWG
jgi:hypothetical protein